MLDFLSDVVATFIGIMLFVLVLAYTTADPITKTGCDIQTSNPVAQTTCIIATTLQS